MSPSCCGKLDLGKRKFPCRANSEEENVVTQGRCERQTDLKDIEDKTPWPW